MLVLSREEGEELLMFVPGIESPIIIEFVKARKQRAQVAIDAVREIVILRREVYEHNLAEARRRGEQPLTLPPKPL